MPYPTPPAGFSPQPDPSNWGRPNPHAVSNISPTPDQMQARMDWRTALQGWQDQRPTRQSVFPDFTGGQPTDGMHDQFRAAMSTWQGAMPQMPASLAALMPQGHSPMPGQMQQGFISGPAPNPLQNPPMSAPTI